MFNVGWGWKLVSNNKNTEDKKQLTIVAKIIVFFLFVFSLLFGSITGIFYLAAYAGIGFVGYVIFEHYLGIGIIGTIITVVFFLYIHIWLDGGFDKSEEKEAKKG